LGLHLLTFSAARAGSVIVQTSETKLAYLG